MGFARVELGAAVRRPAGQRRQRRLAGFSTTDVRRECANRRWWLPVVSRAGEGKPIARRAGATGVMTAGKDDGAGLWSAKIAAGRVRFPAEINRRQLAELAAAECLTAEGGRLAWRVIEGRQNHYWDSALLAVHARHFRPLTSARRPLRLVAV